MSDWLSHTSSGFIGWQIGNAIIGKPVDTSMVVVGVFFFVGWLALEWWSARAVK